VPLSRFDEAYNRIIAGHEGGYVNDPDDAGGETYKGVSRRFFPDWPGWAIIDRLKREDGFPGNLMIPSRDTAELNAHVRIHFRETFWNRFAGDQLPSEEIAVELFDQSVHMGPPRAIMHLQRVLNVLNINEKLYPDLEVDGVFGPKTFHACQVLLGSKAAVEANHRNHLRQQRYLLVGLNALQGAYYIERMEKRPTNEKYRGWFDRAIARLP